MHKQIRFCGLGGQGMVLAGFVLGRACMEAGLNVVQTQSYGPEATGGASRSEVVVSDTEIDHPSVLEADIFVAMSQPAYDKYIGDVSPDACIIIDPHYVMNHGENVFFVEATRIAESVGAPMAANMVMTGVVSEILGLSQDALKKAIEKILAPKIHETNFAAMRKGFSEGERIKGFTKK